MARKFRGFSLLLCIAILVGLLAIPAAAAETLDDDRLFSQQNVWTEGKFEDVRTEDWFYEYVKSAYELGLMIGDSDVRFNPNGKVTLAETITIAARLSVRYQEAEDQFVQGTPWYQTYVDYALEEELIAEPYSDYNRPATRGEFAQIITAALPEEALEVINEVLDGEIPDVDDTAAYAEAVYSLYRAGILIGVDAEKNFEPESNIKRSEAAAVLSRLADEYLRVEIEDPDDPEDPDDTVNPDDPEDPDDTVNPDDPEDPAEPSSATEAYDAFVQKKEYQDNPAWTEQPAQKYAIMDIDQDGIEELIVESQPAGFRLETSFAVFKYDEDTKTVNAAPYISVDGDINLSKDCAWMVESVLYYSEEYEALAYKPVHVDGMGSVYLTYCSLVDGELIPQFCLLKQADWVEGYDYTRIDYADGERCEMDESEWNEYVDELVAVEFIDLP